MAEALSIAAGIVGIVTAAAQITKLLTGIARSLKDAPEALSTAIETVEQFSGALSLAKNLLDALQVTNNSGAAYVQIDQLNVLVSASYEACISLKDLLDDISSNTAERTRLDWARKESSVQRAIERLKTHASSLTLLVSILGAKQINDVAQSIAGFQKDVQRLNQNLERADYQPHWRTIAAANANDTPRHSLSLAINDAEGSRNSTLQVPRSSQFETESALAKDVVIGATASSSSRRSRLLQLGSPRPSSLWSIESVLQRSRPYRKLRLSTSDSQFSASEVGSFGTSYLSGLNLSQVSNLSVVNLALSEVGGAPQTTRALHDLSLTDDESLKSLSKLLQGSLKQTALPIETHAGFVQELLEPWTYRNFEKLPKPHSTRKIDTRGFKQRQISLDFRKSSLELVFCQHIVPFLLDTSSSIESIEKFDGEDRDVRLLNSSLGDAVHQTLNDDDPEYLEYLDQRQPSISSSTDRLHKLLLDDLRQSRLGHNLARAHHYRQSAAELSVGYMVDRLLAEGLGIREQDLINALGNHYGNVKLALQLSSNYMRALDTFLETETARKTLAQADSPSLSLQEDLNEVFFAPLLPIVIELRLSVVCALANHRSLLGNFYSQLYTDPDLEEDVRRVFAVIMNTLLRKNAITVCLCVSIQHLSRPRLFRLLFFPEHNPKALGSVPVKEALVWNLEGIGTENLQMTPEHWDADLSPFVIGDIQETGLGTLHRLQSSGFLFTIRHPRYARYYTLTTLLSNRQKFGMSLRSRLCVALTIAARLLDIARVGWLHPTWASSDIVLKVMRHATKAVPLEVYFQRDFRTQQFSDYQIGARMGRTDIKSFAVVLIELTVNHNIFLPKSEGYILSPQDFLAEEIDRADCIANGVGQIIRDCRSEGFTSQEDPNLVEADEFHRKVVEPLQKMCETVTED